VRGQWSVLSVPTKGVKITAFDFCIETSSGPMVTAGPMCWR
jgi:hypothetical protein